MFRKELTLGRVHDTVTIREGDERLKLKVDADPQRVIAGLSQAQKKLQGLNDDSTDEDRLNAAKYFALVMFGEDQANKLSEFYRDDPGCVINICGKYFSERLAKLIEKAQKK